jgi:hypothetical protein
MAENKARVGELAVSTDGSSYSDVGHVLSCNIAFDKNKADITDYDDAGYVRETTITQRATISGECNYDPTDAGQAILLTALHGQTAIYFRYYPKGNTGGFPKYIFTSEPTGSVDGDQGGVLTLSFDAPSDGTVTASTI